MICDHFDHYDPLNKHFTIHSVRETSL